MLRSSAESDGRPVNVTVFRMRLASGNEVRKYCTGAGIGESLL
jgi:hypothetical protein